MQRHNGATSLNGLLTTLRQRNIQLSVDGEHLRCSAPVGALTPDLRGEIQQRKRDILEFLRTADELVRQQPAIVPLRASGTRTPIFATAGHNGDVFCYRALVHHLGEDQPFFGLQPPGLDGHSEPLTCVKELGGYFAEQIRAFIPDGPYIIAGYCAGGGIAFELAQQLRRGGAAIERVALFGSPFSTWYRRGPQLRHHLKNRIGWLARHACTLSSLPSGQRRQYVAEKLRNRKAQVGRGVPAGPDPVLLQREKVEEATLVALRRYEPQFFHGGLSIFFPSKESLRFRALSQWRSVVQHTDEYVGPDGCNGDNMLREQYALAFAKMFHSATRQP